MNINFIAAERNNISRMANTLIMTFYPDDLEVPKELKTDEFLIRPLRASDVELDYEAVMESKDMLREISQSTWPTDDFTLAENLDDLERHEKDHIDRREFTYTVMNPEETICLGCLYLRPLSQDMVQGDLETSVIFWIRQSRIADNLDNRFLRILLSWLESDWFFKRKVFITGANAERQAKILMDSGLKLLKKQEFPDERKYAYYE